MAIDDVELKHLRVFIAVAQTQNFSHAAKACGVSQSTVSTIIQQLEQELGVRLIDRTTRRVTLSRLGEELLPGARRILSEFDRQIAGMRELQALNGGHVHIACVPSVAMELVPKVLRRFRCEHPRVGFKIYEVPRGRCIDMVRSGEADLAIANDPTLLSETACQPLMEDVFALIMRKDHPLASHAQVSWTEARNAGLVMMAEQTGIRLELEHILPPEILDGQIFYEAIIPSTLLSLVRHGIGVAPLPSLAWPSVDDRELTVRPLHTPTVTRSLHLVWRSGRSLTPAAEMCRTIIAEVASDYRSCFASPSAVAVPPSDGT